MITHCFECDSKVKKSKKILHRGAENETDGETRCVLNRSSFHQHSTSPLPTDRTCLFGEYHSVKVEMFSCIKTYLP